MKLVQKHFLKGSRTFEIVDDVVNVRIRSLLKEEKLTVMLTILNPEPVLNPPFLEFHSRVKCSPLLSLLINKPNVGSFDAFVNELKQRARQEYNAFAGLKSGSTPEGLAANVYEEPPEFDDPQKKHTEKKLKPVSVEKLDIAMQMLEQHLHAGDIEALLTALKALRKDPENESNFSQLIKAFDELGPQQGAVLTYAPYVSMLLSEVPFEY